MTYSHPSDLEAFARRMVSEESARRIYEDRRRYVQGATVIRDKMIEIVEKETPDAK